MMSRFGRGSPRAAAADPSGPAGTSGPRGLWDKVWLAIVWHYATFAVMVLLALLGEGTAAPTLPDRLVRAIPYVHSIGANNYRIWLVAYVPLAIGLWRLNRRRFIEFIYVGGLLNLVRGATILVTTLGPINGRDVNALVTQSQVLHAWLQIINPLRALTTSAPHIYLTKDLYFSGHTASTFLLWLYCREHRTLGPLALIAHLIIVTTVFLSHLHYTIDVIGAWTMTFTAFVLAERWFSQRPAATGAVQVPLQTTDRA